MIEAFFEILSYIDKKATLIMTMLPLATPLSLDVIFFMWPYNIAIGQILNLPIKGNTIKFHFLIASSLWVFLCF